MIGLDDLTAELISGRRAVMVTDGSLGHVLWGEEAPQYIAPGGAVLHLHVDSVDGLTIHQVRSRLAALGMVTHERC